MRKYIPVGKPYISIYVYIHRMRVSTVGIPPSHSRHTINVQLLSHLIQSRHCKKYNTHFFIGQEICLGLYPGLIYFIKDNTTIGVAVVPKQLNLEGPLFATMWKYFRIHQWNIIQTYNNVKIVSFFMKPQLKAIKKYKNLPFFSFITIYIPKQLVEGNLCYCTKVYFLKYQIFNTLCTGKSPSDFIEFLTGQVKFTYRSTPTNSQSSK